MTALADPSPGSALAVDIAGGQATLDVRGRIEPLLLQGVVDRAEAFGGEVTVTDGDPAGIRVRLPAPTRPPA